MICKKTKPRNEKEQKKWKNEIQSLRAIFMSINRFIDW